MSGLLADRSLEEPRLPWAEWAIGGSDGRCAARALLCGVVRPTAGAVNRALSSGCHPFGKVCCRLKGYRPFEEELVRVEMGESDVGEKYESMPRSVGDIVPTPPALASCRVCNDNEGVGTSLSMGNLGGGTLEPF